VVWQRLRRSTRPPRGLKPTWPSMGSTRAASGARWAAASWPTSSTPKGETAFARVPPC